ncbi:MAG TPA: hypothetical protein VFE78_04940 [Gemmataceae bacterium]|jgi:hypothetical protein|nr:hypothetical protein [Gemmataceae bacterium]
MQAVLESVAEEAGAAFHVPDGPEGLAGHYDLTISHPAVHEPRFAAFEGWLARAAAEFGLSCGLIHDGVVHEAIRRLDEGRLAVGFHLDYFALWHRPDDPYARLAVAVQDAGGHPVNLPARARAFTDKASAHAELVRRGLGVPPTVVLRPWAAERALSAAEWRRLRLDEPGACAYVKAANGFGGRGVVRVEQPDAGRLAAAVAEVRRQAPGDACLVQRAVTPPLLACEDGTPRPAYWRVLDCLGERTAFWWQPPERVGPGRPSYRAVTPAELRRHRLQPLLDFARDLAGLSGLGWFSTELCLGDGHDGSRYAVTGADGRERPVLAIDYVNDQCDVDVQSRWAGAPPDDAVRRAAARFAEAAWQVRQKALRPASVVSLRAA